MAVAGYCTKNKQYAEKEIREISLSVGSKKKEKTFLCVMG